MNKQTFTVFFGDTSEYPMQCAREYDPTATLMDHNNYQTLFENPTGTVYSSLGDLPKDPLLVYQLLNKADKIFYCNKEGTVWSDNKKVNLNNITESVQGLTEFILFQINNLSKKVYNLDLTKYQPDSYVKLLNHRRNDSQQLWVSGGSDVDGYGVLPTERFGQLLANRLNLPVSFLSKAASSIEYQADQILRSDIQEDDLVLWGIPCEYRIPFWSDRLSEVIHLHTRHRELGLAEDVDLTPKTIDMLLTNKHCFYQSILHIHQVINFCNKSKAKLLIVGLTISDELTMHLHNIPNFLTYTRNQFENPYIDFGSDGEHPGPKQHQAYADFCYLNLKKLNYI